MSSPRRQLPSSDEVLVEQLKTADWRPALAELWERNLPVFWGVARNSTRSDDDASDVLSEVFTQLAERADRGELVVASSFRAYVIRAVRNRATTLGGRRDREAPTDFDATSEPPVLVEQDRFTLSADNALVAEAFAALPEPSRNVLWLSEVEGLPPREVAEVLATTPNNAAQLASRARSSFRESWIRLHLSLKDVATGCEPFAVELPAYLGGKLSATRTSSLEGHLEGCAHCRGLAADLSDDMRPLRALAVPVPIGVAGLAAARLLLDADTAHAASLSEPALPGSGPPEASSTTPGGGDEIAASGLPDPPGGVGSTSGPPEPVSGVGALSGTASKGLVALVSVVLLAVAITGVAIWRTVDGRGEPGSTETAQIEASGSAGPAGEQAGSGLSGGSRPSASLPFSTVQTITFECPDGRVLEAPMDSTYEQRREACGLTTTTTPLPPLPEPLIERVEWDTVGSCGDPTNTLNYTVLFFNGESETGSITINLDSSATAYPSGGGQIQFWYGRPEALGGVCNWGASYS